MEQLISYIAPAAPATRRPIESQLPFLRLELGFTPGWYRKNCNIDFGKRYHHDVLYRKEAQLLMRKELQGRFPNYPIGLLDKNKCDLLTGVYGGCFVAAIYGIEISYYQDNWPACSHNFLTEEQIDDLTPPDLNYNPVFLDLERQVKEISKEENQVIGFVNWQGVINNALKIRGNDLFFDFYDKPERCHRLFDCICQTMIEGIKKLHKWQKESGVMYNFFTVSNCSVNMLSPELYEEFLLSYDKKIASEFSLLGIHNCAWNANPYMEAYSSISNLGYIDMGIDSDMSKAKLLFPQSRRAIMYTPMDLKNKSWSHIVEDITRIANEYAPCDLIVADIESDVEDQRVLELINLCERIKYA